MKTRIARQLDVLRLRSLEGHGMPVVAASPLDDPPGVAAALLVPGGEKVWLAEDDENLAGYAQARPRKYVLGWELLRVEVRKQRNEEDVCNLLVQEVLQYLQDRGIPRLFARVPDESHGQDVLRRCGFTMLLSESIWVRKPKATRAPDETPFGLRYRMPQDAWPLRQLEHSQTPQLISQLEGLTSASWSMPRKQMFRKEEPADLIIERDGEIVGWAGWSFVGAGHGLSEHARLGLLSDEEQPDLAQALLDYALYSITSKRPSAQIIVRLRDYQVALASALQLRGFTESARECVLIKHGRLQTAPKGPRKLFELAPAKRTALSLETRIELLGSHYV